MEKKQFLDYIEDKIIKIENDWFFHATDRDIITIEKILYEGIKCAALRKEKSQQGYNGKYYVSISKKTNNPQSVYNLFEHLPIFVIKGINPIKADDKNRIFAPFTETILPLRTSSKADEYHAFFKINSSKIIAIAYNLYHTLESEYDFDIYKLCFLKDLILLLEKLEKDIPIYDLVSKRQINKEKVKSLKIDEIDKIIY